MTKLDVLDGVEQIKIGVGYRYKGQFLDVLTYGAHAAAEAEPVLEEMAGWAESTVGITEYDKLPVHERRDLERTSDGCDVPIDKIGRASCRGRGCEYGKSTVVP